MAPSDIRIETSGLIKFVSSYPPLSMAIVKTEARYIVAHNSVYAVRGSFTPAMVKAVLASVLSRSGFDSAGLGMGSAYTQLPLSS